MRNLGLFPDGFTFPLLIKCCSFIGDPKLSRSVIACAFVSGYSLNLHVANEMILMLGRRGELALARYLFEEMPERSIISWNTLLSGYVAAGDVSCAVDLFRRMELEGWEPSPVSWTSLLSVYVRNTKIAIFFHIFSEMISRGVRPTPESLSVVLSGSTEMGLIQEGKMVHSFIVRDGFERYVFVRNSLISFYGMLGVKEEDAEMIFFETEQKNLVSWNCMISCHAARFRHEKAIDLLQQMRETPGIVPNIVTWSAVIGGLVSGGRFLQSLEIFRKMQDQGVKPNSVTLATVLSSCSEISALHLGKEIHCYFLRSSFEETSDTNLVENGLISMYAKSGSLKLALLVFHGMPARDLISWNAMISGYGVNGQGREALSLYNDMINAGIDPDGVSYVAVLSACAHAGLVAAGQKLFQQMPQPGVEHYACMVDLLGRAGLLKEAHRLVEEMPMKPNIFIWGALLRSCKMHGERIMAEEVGERVLGFAKEEGIAGSCAMMANVYAECAKWDEVGRVRLMMRRRDIRKRPGQSWIEVEKVVHVFSSGDLVKPEMEVVCQVLDELTQLMERWD